jgi:hypothetical protein
VAEVFLFLSLFPPYTSTSTIRMRLYIVYLSLSLSLSSLSLSPYLAPPRVRSPSTPLLLASTQSRTVSTSS